MLQIRQFSDALANGRRIDNATAIPDVHVRVLRIRQHGENLANVPQILTAKQRRVTVVCHEGGNHRRQAHDFQKNVELGSAANSSTWRRPGQ